MLLVHITPNKMDSFYFYFPSEVLVFLVCIQPTFIQSIFHEFMIGIGADRRYVFVLLVEYCQ